MMNRIIIVLCSFFIVCCTSVETDKNPEAENEIVKDTVHSFDKNQMVNYIRESEDKILKNVNISFFCVMNKRLQVICFHDLLLFLLY